MSNDFACKRMELNYWPLFNFIASFNLLNGLQLNGNQTLYFKTNPRCLVYSSPRYGLLSNIDCKIAIIDQMDDLLSEWNLRIETWQIVFGRFEHFKFHLATCCISFVRAIDALLPFSNPYQTQYLKRILPTATLLTLVPLEDVWCRQPVCFNVV